MQSIDLDAIIGEEFAIRTSICRESFADFCVEHWPALEPNGRPLIRNVGTDALIEHLQAVGDGAIRRLAIAIAPGFGKSTFASVAFPAWMWARRPSWRVICASHAYSLAVHIAGRARRVICDDEYMARYGVRLTSDRTDAFENQHGGKRFSMGVMGALTGFRADGAIIDDAINAMDAHSPLELAKVNDWYDTALTTRLDRGDEASIVVIGQRLAEDDLLGHLDGYEMLTLPSEFERSRRCVTCIWEDPRTDDGELLAPELQSAEYLAERRAIMGSFAYAGQYQQRPAPLEGGMVKRHWWRWFREPGGRLAAQRPRGCSTGDAIELPALREILISCDLGFKGGVEHDNTAMAVVGVHGADRFVLDLVAKPMEFTEQIAALAALRAKWPTAHRILVEDSANAASLMSKLRHDVAGLIAVPARDKKEARVAAMTPMMESGNVYLRDGAPWAEDVVDESALFPNGRRDDRIDAIVQALKYLSASAASAPPLIGSSRLFGMR